MADALNTGKQQRKPPTGKPFVKGDPRINRAGAPKRGQSWAETIKRITDMTAGEAIQYVGDRSRVAKLLKELPADLPIKDALVFISIIHYGREPNARMFQALTDREEGKPAQPITGADGGSLEIVVKYADDQSDAPETT